MRADIKAMAKKNFKPKPSFEIMEPTQGERERGEKVAAYQAKKQDEAARMQALEDEVRRAQDPRI